MVQICFAGDHMFLRYTTQIARIGNMATVTAGRIPYQKHVLRSWSPPRGVAPRADTVSVGDVRKIPRGFAWDVVLGPTGMWHHLPPVKLPPSSCKDAEGAGRSAHPLDASESWH